MKPNILTRCLIKFYNFYLLYFARHKLKRYLLTRKEKRDSCIGCGFCCIGCPALDKNDKTCKIWDYTDYICRNSPFSPLHLKLKGYDVKKMCRYYWEKNEKN